MAANQRIVIVNEDDDAKASITSRGTKGAVAVEVVDSSGTQITNFTVPSATSVGDGTVSIDTTGTAKQISSISVACSRVFIQAHESNTGRIVVGASTVVGALSGRRGVAFYKTQGDWFNVNNLNLLYIDGTISGDKISYYYEV